MRVSPRDTQQAAGLTSGSTGERTSPMCGSTAPRVSPRSPLRPRRAHGVATARQATVYLVGRRRCGRRVTATPSTPAGGGGRETIADGLCAARGRCRMKGAPPCRRDRLRYILADLRMPGALEALDAILHGVDGARSRSPKHFEQLLSAQIQLRNNRRLQAAMRSSRLPAVKCAWLHTIARSPMPVRRGRCGVALALKISQTMERTAIQAGRPDVWRDSWR